MPAFSDITVKKADGTTNVVFTGVQRSAGEKSPALYQQMAGFNIASRRPSLSILAKPHGTRTGVRTIRMDGRYPIVVIEGGMEKVVSVLLSGCVLEVPQSAPMTDVTEAVHQLLNAAASAAMKQSAIDGFAPA